MADLTEILAKVAKILARAEGTTFNEEADTARKMAAEMLAKHNLTYADLASQDAPFIVQTIDLNERPKIYDQELFACLAKFAGCAYLKSHEDNPKHYHKFIGRTQDLEAAFYFIEVVLHQRQVAWDEVLEANKRVSRTMLNEWHNGYAVGVKQKLDELNSMKNKKVQEWGLVPVDPARNAMDWYKELNKVSSGRKQAFRYSNAGIEAGRSASIHQGVGKKDTGKSISYMKH